MLGTLIIFSFLTALTIKTIFIRAYTDIPCQWNSKASATFDLRKLTITSDSQACYNIRDGDIPCTPEIEPTYSYVWNFCADVTKESFPDVCNPQKPAAAYQFIHRLSDNYQECNVIGHYDPTHDDTYFSLMNPNDPSQGVSLTYQFGDPCGKNVNLLRSATIDIQCANVQAEVLSALETSKCQYHLQMNSYYGCPTECPITENGLCNSHGHCAFDPVLSRPRCYCNSGFSGDACDAASSSSSSSSASEGLGVQIGLTVTLLVICLVLVGFVGYLAVQITEFRKAQYMSFVSGVSSSSSSSHGFIGGGEGTELSPIHRH